MFVQRVRSTTHERQRGQAVTEFALILPLLVTGIMAVFEFGVALAATTGINRAAQNGAHMASIAGSFDGADCFILDRIEQSVLPPNDRGAIESVRIELTDLDGSTVYAQNEWKRTGSTTCVGLGGEEIEMPYTLVSEGYPDDQRCSVLRGCPAMSPARSTVDNIGVVVRYRHDWITPLGGAIPLRSDEGGGWVFEQRNVFRMEPHR